MKQIQDTVSGHKIKRNFRYHRKYQHSAQISAEITGVIKSLNYHEGKYRKCYSSYARKYIHIRKQRCPHVITEHACHRNDMQHTGAEYSCLYIPGLFPRINHFTILYIRHIDSSFLYDFVILVPNMCRQLLRPC